MSITDPPDTLAYHQSRVLCQHRNVSNVPCSTVAKSLKAAIQTMGQVTPEQEALAFYGMNHAMALISARRDQLEPLPEIELRIVERYHERSVKEALRAFYYLLVICTRESRHNKSLNKDGPTLEKKFGPNVSNFHLGVSGGESSIHQKLLSQPPDATLGNYCKSLQWVFYHSTWGGGYGGKKWGQVADCMVRYVTGEYTAEMMMDTVWTLSHNNGPIFNKGVLYGHYTMEHILRILDVQRSGQIPEMILWDKQVDGYVPQELADDMVKLAKASPGSIGGYVDWFKVELLGAKKKYDHDKALQASQHGVPPHASDLQKQVALQNAAAAAAAAAYKKQQADDEKKFLETHFEVMPGQYVKKVDRYAA